MILDMRSNIGTTMILSQPFLANLGVVINVHEKLTTLKVDSRVLEMVKNWNV